MHDKHLLRLAVLLVRDQATAEQVVRDVLASRPAQERDVQADRQAVVNRCRVIIRKRHDHPDG